MNENTNTLSLLMAAFARGRVPDHGPPHLLIGTPPELGILADFLEETQDPRLPAVRELVNAKFRISRVSKDFPAQAVACGSWWQVLHSTASARAPSSGTWEYVRWEVYADSPQWKALRAYLPQVGHERALTSSRRRKVNRVLVPSMAEWVRLRLVAAVLGHSMGELEARVALVSDNAFDVVLGLLMRGCPADAVAELRETNPARFREACESARRYRDGNCPQLLHLSLCPYADEPAVFEPGFVPGSSWRLGEETGF